MARRLTSLGRVLVAVALAGALALGANAEGRADPPPEPVIAFLSDGDNPASADEGLFEGLDRLDLYVVRPDGSDVRRLTRNRIFDFAPACTPDGREIAFTRVRRNANIWVMQVDGTGLRRLTSSPLHESQSSWSADGSRIVFTRSRRDSGDLFTMSADGSDQRPLVVGPRDDYWPLWSPTRDRVAFLRGRNPNDVRPDLYVIEADGRGLRKLVADVDGDRVAWSPDGRQLALTRTVRGSSDIWILDVDALRIRRLDLGLENPPSSPAWSPDGTSIAFATGFAIKTVPITGGRATVVTEPDPFEVENWMPTWCRGE